MVDASPSVNGRKPVAPLRQTEGEHFTVEDANTPGEAMRASDEAKAVSLLAKGSKAESGGPRNKR